MAIALNSAAMERKYWVTSRFKEKQYDLTDEGEVWLRSIGINASHRHGGHGFARACLDWSERRHHVAGELGSLLLDRFLELKWIARIPGNRSIRVTDRGQEEFQQHFGLVLRG